MYKGLYDNFAHWFHDGKGQVYFYSDPHFSDEEMVYIRKNYIGDEEQVKRINSKIGKNDTIVILGDIGNVDWVRKIRGYKVLITGNHDVGASKYKRRIGMIENHEYVEKDNHLFDEVYEGVLTISEKIILSHEPIDFPYALNIHGHDHSNWYRDDGKCKHMNVCAEWINYTPVCLKSIIESGVLKDIPEIHRETIDEATARHKKKNN